MDCYQLNKDSKKVASIDSDTKSNSKSKDLILAESLGDSYEIKCDEDDTDVYNVNIIEY